MTQFLFENDEEFQQYMGNTIAYNNMQNTISKLVKFVRPQYLIEFGSGNGATSIRLAHENANTSIVAVDLREKMVGLSKDKILKNKVKNVTFVNGDLTKLSNYNLNNANLVLMMYSFKYISDPLENKIEFLTDLYTRMQPGAYLIIGDTFIEDETDKKAIQKQLEDRYYNNSKDAFWNSLQGLTETDIDSSLEVQKLNRDHTKHQIKLAVDRDGVYYVSRNWLKKVTQKIGFKIVLSERLNSLSDTIFVLVKE